MNRLERRERLERTLRRARTGTLVLAIGREPSDRVELQGVCSAVAGHEIDPRQGATLETAEPGAVLILQLSRLDFIALNLERGLLRDKRLRAVIWASPLLAAHFAREAPDLFSWIQLTLSWHEAQPDGPTESPHRLAAQAEDALHRGDRARAVELFQHCLALDVEAQDERAAAWDREHLAHLAELAGEWSEAERWRAARP